MKAVAIIANLDKSHVHQIAGRICAWCQGRDIRVYAQKELKCGDGSFDLGEPLPPVDLVMVLGGDGTFLSAARRYGASGLPFLGVNLGHLGFLAEVEVADLDSALQKLVNHEYEIEQRGMLSVRIIRQGEVVEHTFALNDAAIAKGTLARIIRLDVAVDNAPIGCYYGDGLIVSTPTGSTGYSLSAGGPIVAPNVNLVLITPICPHTLHARSIAVARDSLIAVEVKSNQREIFLTVDGQCSFPLQFQDRLEISNSSYHTSLVRLHGKHFFDILREKLMEQNR